MRLLSASPIAALPKRGYHGTYHKIGKKHLARYMAEFSVRHNLRPLDIITQMEELTKRLNEKWFPLKILTAQTTNPLVIG